MADLYRLRLGLTTGSGSWSDVEYFENEEKFHERLLRVEIEVHADYLNRKTPRPVWLACLDWLKKVCKKDEGQPYANKIHAAERLVDGEWTPVTYRFVPPSLEEIS